MRAQIVRMNTISVPGSVTDHTRRSIISLLSGAGLFLTSGRLSAAAHFWETRPAPQWTTEELEELITNSPWAKQVNAQYRAAMDDVRVQPGREPTQGRGEARAGECGLVPCSNIMPGRVAVIWESAQPIREGLHPAIPAEMNGRYVISVRGLAGDYTPDRLASASDLSAKGKPPVQAGIVRQRNNTWLFGFSKDLIPLDATDKEVQFTIHTGASLTGTLVRATFNPKDMIYRGAPAL